ncbi:PREDICTED: telomerase reverse transcriptase-like, partial [Dufourea novaeangliae]|uniref:telomerase reverse transcriptase-like n=1 Tax=Dufourea novaeangliae TaxID=178035 RepID=UPI0007674764
MDDSTLESVKEVFGTDFQQYCKRHKITLKKDKCGTFMVPNVNILTECIDILDRSKFKINDRLMKIQKPKASLNSGDNKKQHFKRLPKDGKNNNRKKQNFYEKTRDISPNLFLTNLPLQIYVYDTSSILPSHTIHTVSTDYILNTAKTGNEIYEFIVKDTMKDVVIVNFETSISFISSLLKQFQTRHKRFHYSSVLQHLTQEHESNKELKCKYEVSRKQLYSFFDLIFSKVVPLAIFGKLRNLKKIKKAMHQLLNIPRFKSLNLMLLIEKLDISSITWLKSIQSLETQWLVLAKLVKWFFTGYLLKVLRIQFHITSLSAANNERLYIARSNWSFIQKKFIKKKISSNTLQPEIECTEWNPPIGIYKLRPKHSSVRPIFLSEYQENDKNDLNTVFKFLRQLHITEYGLTNFQEKWKSIIQCKRKSKTEKMYIVSCDVIDAFGSIIQSQLYDIIKSLCKKIPEVLILSSYAVKCERNKTDNTLCYKKYFSNANLQLPLPFGTLYACTSKGNSQCVRKSWLLEKIWKYIFYQRVKIRKKIYIIGKGIVQGTMLSPILSDIYYNFVLQKEMSSFLNCGEIIRYMDDILYVTANEILAKEFLELIKKGIPQYNCYFKELKTQSNIVDISSPAVHSITYIGYKINCDTLEVEPKHADTNIRYLISFSSKNDLTPLELLKKRLHNVACLKLSKVVLDNEINSEMTMMKILKQTCLIQAKRAKVLVKELFNDVELNSQDIFKVLKNSNKKIARHVIKILLTFEENMSGKDIREWNKKILRVLWISYKKIFKKDK